MKKITVGLFLVVIMIIGGCGTETDGIKMDEDNIQIKEENRKTIIENVEVKKALRNFYTYDTNLPESRRAFLVTVDPNITGVIDISIDIYEDIQEKPVITLNKKYGTDEYYYDIPSQYDRKNVVEISGLDFPLKSEESYNFVVTTKTDDGYSDEYTGYFQTGYFDWEYEGFIGKKVVDMKINYDYKGEIFVLTSDNYTETIWESLDNGKTYIPFFEGNIEGIGLNNYGVLVISLRDTAGLFLYRDGKIEHLAEISLYYESISFKYLTEVKRKFYAISDDGIWMSQNGMDWNLIDESNYIRSIKMDHNVTYILIDNYILKIIDNVVTKIHLANNFENVSSITAQHGILYLTTDKEIYVSEDQGNTWVHMLDGNTEEITELFHLNSGNKIHEIVIISTDNLLCQTTFNIMYSHDGGATWAKGENSPGYNIDIVTNYEGEIFVSSAYNGILLSNNQGESYEEINYGIVHENNFPYIVTNTMKMVGSKFYTLTDYGLYRYNL